MNFKKIILAVLAVLVIGCQDDTEVFDHAGQYKIEKVEIATYLATHYYNSENDQFENLVEGKTSLANDEKLKAVETNYNNIDYTMYTYETVVGTGNSPDTNDIVNIVYKLTSLENELYQENDVNDGFLDLTTVIPGWQIGLPSFKEGTYDETTDPSIPRQYKDSGEGLMIVPSGLAYQNFGSGLISANETLVFKIVLRSVGQIENE
ncbi:FKBP-type peptidyl-prolyl cis-trans isomerase [Wenyingzhuangia heitensis]|uniref:peptidylprolyl isomerase n=1 Tax=Wenyingzhuangia heitensis TaxID=1487859 RepID=A0ABX0UBD6_9FLAO|nr:FKBP-type peptidyl-prolyl cis-trans isomerase [Wenyingzhuangia heitensis]NIJ46043.1 FKBP-type peptidyl-prolyl cis-trans isomerase [Wenyingzhuangia heitensis]